MTATTQQSEVQVLHKLDFRDTFEAFLPSIPSLGFITDEDMRNDLTDLVTSPEYDQKRTVFAIEALLMADLLEAAGTDEIVNLADEKFTQVTKLFRDNQRLILETIRPFEQTMRSLHLFFQNAGEGSDVENAFFMSVDPALFAGTKNPDHFKELVLCLENRFYAWKLMQSPIYIGYVGDIQNRAFDLSKIAQKTLAMAIVDVMEASKPEAVLEKVKMRKINGIEENWGHLVVSGTWLVGREAYAGLESQPLCIPSAAAIVGKMMAMHDEGGSIGGFENGALSGAFGVRYAPKKYTSSGSDTRDSATFRKNGMLIIGWEEGQAVILGDATAANQSKNEDLRKISKMMVSNGILKDLINFCNLKAYSTWGKQQKKDFKEQLEEYLNTCIRRHRIQGYSNVEVLDINGDEVDINVEIIYFETKSQYNIKITGKKDQLDISAKNK